MMKTGLLVIYGLVLVLLIYRMIDMQNTARSIQKLKKSTNDSEKIKVNLTKEISAFLMVCICAVVSIVAIPNPKTVEMAAVTSESVMFNGVEITDDYAAETEMAEPVTANFPEEAKVEAENSFEASVTQRADKVSDVDAFLSENGLNASEMTILDEFDNRFVNKCIASEIINGKIYQLYCDNDEYVILVSDIIRNEEMK